ncbi:MAG: hypothetical protein IKW85_09760 [Muribaculaceae bacterium]|nr:hypothetical protein [Muribaculaceae bacterium]
MKDMKTEIKQRYLCEQRDKEFLELYHPTLDAMLQQGLPLGKARRAAVEFTIANGHPHYHVDMERAYRCVCHLISSEQKKASNARTYRTATEMQLAKRRLRQQMWFEITQHVVSLLDRGMSVERAIAHVLEHCRASRFFITPTTALTRICSKSRCRALR